MGIGLVLSVYRAEVQRERGKTGSGYAPVPKDPVLALGLGLGGGGHEVS